MSKSKKGGRGVKMTLADFGGGQDESNLDWARDEFAPTPPTAPAEAGEQPPALDAQGKKKDWRDFGFKVGAMSDNFREQGPVVNTKVVPDDMQPPFVAYVGNLPHSIQEDGVKLQFDNVVDVKLVKNDRGERGGSTFAYVEFESREALQFAILLTGKKVGGRPIRVDMASDAQRNRLEQEKNGGKAGSGRESAVIGRDAMGSLQPDRPRGMGSRMGSRNTSAMDLNRDFSRDSMGQNAGSDMGSPAPEISRDAFGESKPRTPNSGMPGRGGGFGFRDRGSKPASPIARGEADFGGWRDSERVSQPAAPNPESPAERGAPTFARRKDAAPRDAPESQQKSPGEFTSWRDTPQQKQPPPPTNWRDETPSDTTEATKAEPKTQAAAPKTEGGSWRDGPATKPGNEPSGGSWRDGPTKQADAKPAENPWRRGPPAAK